MADGRKPFTQAQCGRSALEGFSVGVAVMHRMYESTDPATTAKEFAYALQDAWALGDPACDNGALLLLSVLEDQFVMVAGVGVTTLLPDDAIAGLLEEVRIDVREGRYGAAVEAALYKYGRALAAAHQDHDKGGGGGGGGWHLHVSALAEELLAGLVALVGLGEGLRRWRRRRARLQRRYQDCCGILQDIMQDHTASLRGDFNRASATAQSCSFCLCCAPGSARLAAAVALTVRIDSDGGDGGSSDGDGGSEAALRQPLTSGAAADEADVGAEQLLMLPCGHVFCEPCTLARLDHGSTACPVCCAPLHAEQHSDAAAGPADAAAAAPPGDGGGSTSAPPPPGARPSAGVGFAPVALAGRGVLLQQLRQAWAAGQGTRLRDAQGAGGRASLAAELEFRLQRLQRLFPEFVTPDMVAAWSRDLRSAREMDAQTARALQRRDPGAAAPGGLTRSLAGGAHMLHTLLRRLRAARLGPPRR